jgi:AcrR family transcriptional regulator
VYAVSTPTGRVRLTPEQRRLQLLDLGARLFASRPVEEISIDVLAEEAGVSRGLLYHYFGGKQDFREAVIRHAVEDLVEQTAPPATGEPLQRLHASVGVYVDYVLANLTGYRSLVRAAAGGSEELRAIYEEARTALTDRIFREDSLGEHLGDDPATRLVVRGWSALVEEMVLTWAQDPASMTREALVDTLVGALPALVGKVGDVSAPGA